MHKLMTAAVLAIACVALAAVPSSAQTVVSEPPGLPTTTVAPPEVDVFVVTIIDGVVDLCGFAPGTPVALTWDGSSVGTLTADDTGCVHVPIDVEFIAGTAAGASASGGRFSMRLISNVRQLAKATVCPIEVTVNGHKFNTVAGDHELVGAGTAPSGAPRTVKAIVHIPCPRAEVAGGSTSRTSSGGSGFAFTGRNVSLLVLLAAALIATGAGVRRAGRRRAAAVHVDGA